VPAASGGRDVRLNGGLLLLYINDVVKMHE